MIRIPFSAEQLTEKGVTFDRVDDSLRLSLPDEPGHFYVQMLGEDMLLASDRSASQRKLLDLLAVSHGFTDPAA